MDSLLPKQEAVISCVFSLFPKLDCRTVIIKPHGVCLSDTHPGNFLSVGHLLVLSGIGKGAHAVIANKIVNKQ